MKLPKYSFIISHAIWQPRWHDKVVLIASRKVGEHNVITFDKAPTLEGQWYVSGETIKKYPVENMATKTGGKISVRPVSLDELVLYEGKES